MDNPGSHTEFAHRVEALVDIEPTDEEERILESMLRRVMPAGTRASEAQRRFFEAWVPEGDASEPREPLDEEAVRRISRSRREDILMLCQALLLQGEKIALIDQAAMDFARTTLAIDRATAQHLENAIRAHLRLQDAEVAKASESGEHPPDVSLRDRTVALHRRRDPRQRSGRYDRAGIGAFGSG